MKFQVDKAYMLDCFKEIINIPSPSGYDVELKPVLEKYAEELDKKVTYDNKCTAYITLDGEDSSKTVMLSAHADTIGFVVRRIDSDGKIRIRRIGGLNLCSVECSTVTVHTRDGRKYTGMCMCQAHSTHVFSEATTMPRTEDTMMIVLDEPVNSKADVNNLGIFNGDYISVAPECEITENGYIKSRFIDDKGAIAIVFAMLKYLKDNNLKPKYKTIFSFPYYEELSIGGSYIPDEVSEFIAVDIGLVGPDLDGTEHTVSICARDAKTMHSFELTTRLIEYAKKAGCDYAVDNYKVYGSDANAALVAGHNIKTAACGMAVYGSHARERTHTDGLLNTANLLLAYVLDI